MAEVFGQSILFYRGNTEQGHRDSGFATTVPSERIIFVNVGAPNSSNFIVGNEILPRFKTEQPKAYHFILCPRSVVSLGYRNR